MDAKTSNAPYHAILIDDDADFADSVKAALKRSGITCQIAPPSRRILSDLETWICDVVITDVIMPEVEGLELIQALRKHRPDLPIIAMSGGGDFMPAEINLDLSAAMGAGRILQKPFEMAALIEAIHGLLDQASQVDRA